jgi:hypothetical protein
MAEKEGESAWQKINVRDVPSLEQENAALKEQLRLANIDRNTEALLDDLL